MNFKDHVRSASSNIFGGKRVIAARKARSRSTVAAVAALGIIAAPLAGGTVAHAADTPVVSVTPDTDLDPESSNTLTVSGEGFKPTAPAEGQFGVYVAVAPEGLLDVEGFHLNADAFTGTEWVGSITEDGTFSQEITLDSPIIDSDGTEVDCIEAQCGVYTWAAHGSDDRSQDTFTPIEFATADEGDGEEDGDGEEEGDGDEDIIWEPELNLFDASGASLGDTAVSTGDEIVVRGTGFDPEANVGGRGMPIPAHLPQGYYVVFGNFAPDWEPSSGAPSSARKAADQGWVLPEEVLDEVPEAFQGTIREQWVALDADGSFEATLEASEIDGPEDGVYGIYIYPAGGINNAAYELASPVNFEAEVDSGDGEEPGDGEESGGEDPDEGDGGDDGDNGSGETPSEPDKCLAAESGDFTWGIHGPFLDYVTGPIAGGTVTPVGVTETNSGFKFKLASGSYDSDTDKGVIKYAGSVKFAGHHGALDVELSNPQLHIDGKQATLLVDVTTDGKLDKAVPFAVVDAKGAKKSANAYSLTGAGAVLTEKGSAALQNFYPEGTEISPVTASVALGGDGDCADDVVNVEKPKPTKPNNGGDEKPNGDSNLPIPDLKTPAPKAEDEEVPMCRSTKSATLTWGVKQTFADYVTGPIANGSISTANGVSGQFNWPGASSTFNPETGTGNLAFGGTVTFTGHDGALNMRISNPRIELVNANTARLYANVRSTNPAGKVTIDAQGVHIANLNISGKKSVTGDQVTFSAVPATLTAAGVPAFAEFYEAGSSLDALNITITLGPEVPCAGGGAGIDSLPRTGGDLDLAAAGALFMMFGLAAVGVRRKMSTGK